MSQLMTLTRPHRCSCCASAIGRRGKHHHRSEYGDDSVRCARCRRDLARRHDFVRRGRLWLWHGSYTLAWCERYHDDGPVPWQSRLPLKAVAA